MILMEIATENFFIEYQWIRLLFLFNHLLWLIFYPTAVIKKIVKRVGENPYFGFMSLKPIYIGLNLDSFKSVYLNVCLKNLI